MSDQKEPWEVWTEEMIRWERAAFKAGKRKKGREYSYSKFFAGWGERDVQFVNGKRVGSGLFFCTKKPKPGYVKKFKKAVLG